MRPPAFWSRPPDRPGWQARALAPAALLYASATARRVARLGIAAGIPVICVGNVNAGGTGKTPTVIALIQKLAERGAPAPHVISRGYGGSNRALLRVDPSRHAAAEVGDEPLLLAAFAPVWVGPDRVAAARAAVAGGASALILDDGFQDPALEKDLSLVVVDAEAGFGNGRVIPAGPLREPVARGLERANLLLSIGGNAAQRGFDATWSLPPELPRLEGRLLPLATGMPWEGLRTLAFAGIGRPEKFFATLADLGAEVLRAEPLDDHQPLEPALMLRLEQEAQILGAQLVTTEKDAVRLPQSFRQKVLTLPVRLAFDDPGPLDRALDRLDL